MNFSQFVKACSFAAHKHHNQRRKSGDIPYINHPLEVAQILAAAGVEDVATLCAAVLHDTVEDTETTRAELVEEFGESRGTGSLFPSGFAGGLTVFRVGGIVLGHVMEASGRGRRRRPGLLMRGLRH